VNGFHYPPISPPVCWPSRPFYGLCSARTSLLINCICPMRKALPGTCHSREQVNLPYLNQLQLRKLTMQLGSQNRHVDLRPFKLTLAHHLVSKAQRSEYPPAHFVTNHCLPRLPIDTQKTFCCNTVVLWTPPTLNVGTGKRSYFEYPQPVTNSFPQILLLTPRCDSILAAY
jgi:hypothetical protein